MNHSSFILMDANNPDIDWPKIYYSFSNWVILIGSWAPPELVVMPVSEKDVRLLMPRAQMLLADTDRFSKIAEEAGVPFVLVDRTFEVTEVGDGVTNDYNCNS